MYSCHQIETNLFLFGYLEVHFGFNKDQFDFWIYFPGIEVKPWLSLLEVHLKSNWSKTCVWSSKNKIPVPMYHLQPFVVCKNWLFIFWRFFAKNSICTQPKMFSFEKVTWFFLVDSARVTVVDKWWWCWFVASFYENLKRNRVHGIWKSQKKSHSTLRAKRATFTFWVDKS